MCCSPNSEAVRAATHYYTRAWQTLIYRKECYIAIVIYLHFKRRQFQIILFNCPPWHHEAFNETIFFVSTETWFHVFSLSIKHTGLAAIENVNTNSDLDQSKIGRNIVFDCSLSQLATNGTENTDSSDWWSTFSDCSERSERFRLPPVRCDKWAYFTVIIIVLSFLHKKRRHLNLRTMSLSGLKWQWSPLLPCINGNVARGQWSVNDQPHCDTLNLDEM